MCVVEQYSHTFGLCHKKRHSGTMRSPKPSIVEDFDPPEATTVGHRGLKNPRPSIFEDYGPPEATTTGRKSLENPRASTKSDFGQKVLPQAARLPQTGYLFKNRCQLFFPTLQSGVVRISAKSAHSPTTSPPHHQPTHVK